MPSRFTYVIAGGYTAGHITPGLAVAEELRERHPDLDLLFLGAPRDLDRRLVAAAGVSFVALPAAPWVGQSPAGRATALACLAPAFFAARKKLRAVNALGLASLGSYAALAPGLAARSLGLPLAVFEPNATPGLANRLLRRRAQCVLVSRLFQFPGPAEPVGVPLRRALRAISASPPDRAPCLLVLGGSLGDAFLNERMPAVVRLLAPQLPGLRVVHQCGDGVNPAPLRAHYAAAGVVATVEPFIDPIASALAGAHFAVTAAGAITIHELASAGIPSLVVPLGGAAARHQHDNARAFARATGCAHSSEADWRDNAIASAVHRVLADRAAWQDQHRRLRAFAPADAAGRFVAALGLNA